MTPTLFISATILAILLVVAAAEVSHAHGGGLTEVVDPSTGLTTQGCAEQNAHYSVGRYVSYFYSASDHLHVGSGGGVSAISVTRLRQNPFLYAGYHYDVFGEHYDEYVEWYEEIPDGYTGFRIEYNTTRAAGAVVVICFEVITSDDFQYQAGMFHPLRLGGPGGATYVAPPQGSGGSPGASGQSLANRAPTLTGDTAIRYAENGTGRVATYTATDPENDQISWALSGADGADFSIIQGDLTFNSLPSYEDPTDAEKNNVYQVTVEASDGANTAALDVTVAVADVNEPPEFPFGETSRSVAGTTGPGQSVGAPIEATDPEGDGLTYTLGGTDGASFSIATSTGQLLTSATLERSSYSVIVSVSDGKDEAGGPDSAIDDTANITVNVTGPLRQTRRTSQTVSIKSIPRQFVPINGGSKRILLSEYFSDSDDGFPPYEATVSDSSIASVEVSEGYLVITPVATGVATTTVAVSDSPDIRGEFKTIVYRPVLPRTNTETLHIIDHEVETTLISSDGILTVSLPAGGRDQFFQAAIDALSNNCGKQSPIDERHLCVLVDLFDLDAQSIEETMKRPAELSVSLNKQQFDAVQTDIANGDFEMWKGRGQTETSWDMTPECDEPRGNSECHSLTKTATGGKLTIFNITSFSEFAAGTVVPDPPSADPQPTPSPSTTPPTSGSGSSNSDSGRANTRSSDTIEVRGNQSPQVSGPYQVDYRENDTGPVAHYSAVDPEGDEITWSIFGTDRKTFEVSDDGVLSFRSPPDFENPSGLEGNTYWVILQAEDDGKPSEYDVHNVYVTVTNVNELGAITGDVDLSVAENSVEAVARYQVKDPEKDTIEWSLSGPDASGFKIDGAGNLSPAIDLDFEAPSSSEGSNVHALTITATDDGKPELSSQIEVTLTVSNLNEAPVAREIPDVYLTTQQLPWLLDLTEYFTDPDGDLLTYKVSGHVVKDVIDATLEGSSLSIAPAGEGTGTIELVAADSGGLRAAGTVTVFVTEPEPAPTPVPPEVVEPDPALTPAPLVVSEPSPTHVPLFSQLSERRILNQTQQPDALSKLSATFTIEPIATPVAKQMTLQTVTPVSMGNAPVEVDALEAKGELPSSSAIEEGEDPSKWPLVPMILIAILIIGYFVYMSVIHRVSEPLWLELAGLKHRFLG